MKRFRIAAAFFTLLLTSVASFAQSNEAVEMADVLRRDGKIYTVVAGLVVILTVLIVVLIRVDRKIFKLEQHVKKSDGNAVR